MDKLMRVAAALVLVLAAAVVPAQGTVEQEATAFNRVFTNYFKARNATVIQISMEPKISGSAGVMTFSTLHKGKVKPARFVPRHRIVLNFVTPIDAKYPQETSVVFISGTDDIGTVKIRAIPGQDTKTHRVQSYSGYIDTPIFEKFLAAKNDITFALGATSFTLAASDMKFLAGYKTAVASK